MTLRLFKIIISDSIACTTIKRVRPCTRNGESFLLNGSPMGYVGKEKDLKFNDFLVDTLKMRSSLLTTSNFPNCCG